MAVAVFCNDYLAPRSVDPDFSAEYDAARAAGFDTMLVSYEDLTKGSGLFRPVKGQPLHRSGIYRGWMLTPDRYGQLYRALEELGIQLVNTPTEYAHAHYFPNYYPVISGNTPTSISLRIDGSPDFDRINELLYVFGSKPIVLKDYVKSEKHYWREACYIPNATDREKVERVTRRFLELRGDQLNEGLVYREYIPLAHLAEHSRSGMPIAVEFRLFFANGHLISASPYWEEGEYKDPIPPTTDFERIAKNIRNRFFSMDIAKRADGRWTIMELGDGQVSGLPVALDPKSFYEKLFAAVNTAGIDLSSSPSRKGSPLQPDRPFKLKGYGDDTRPDFPTSVIQKVHGVPCPCGSRLLAVTTSSRWQAGRLSLVGNSGTFSHHPIIQHFQGSPYTYGNGTLLLEPLVFNKVPDSA